MQELKGMALQRGSILSAAHTEGQQQLPHHLSRLPGSYCFLDGIIFSPSNRQSWVYSMLQADRTGEAWMEKFISCFRLFLEVVGGGGVAEVEALLRPSSNVM